MIGPLVLYKPGGILLSGRAADGPGRGRADGNGRDPGQGCGRRGTERDGEKSSRSRERRNCRIPLPGWYSGQTHNHVISSSTLVLPNFYRRPAASVIA